MVESFNKYNKRLSVDARGKLVKLIWKQIGLLLIKLIKLGGSYRGNLFNGKDGENSQLWRSEDVYFDYILFGQC